jgi:hypothetical protein
VIGWVPAARVVVLNAATPEPSSGSATLSAVEPSLNMTVPVGVPLDELTVTVNVTFTFGVDGFKLETSWIFGGPIIFCIRFAVLPVYSVSPL